MRLLMLLMLIEWFRANLAHGANLATFVRDTKPVMAQKRGRSIVHVGNQHLASYVESTKKGYLEVVVPAGKGHIYFRHGEDVFDFNEEGLRVGGVRPIKSARYGYLIPLSAVEEANLGAYLGRLKATGGAELGKYDFTSEKGFHCVTWMKQLALGAHGEDLVRRLGGRPRDWESMPRFARFLQRRARGIESMIVYRDGETTPRELRKKPDIISLRALMKAHRAAQ